MDLLGTKKRKFTILKRKLKNLKNSNLFLTIKSKSLRGILHQEEWKLQDLRGKQKKWIKV